jgi:hypothetical protein
VCMVSVGLTLLYFLALVPLGVQGYYFDTLIVKRMNANSYPCLFVNMVTLVIYIFKFISK